MQHSNFCPTWTRISLRATNCRHSGRQESSRAGRQAVSENCLRLPCLPALTAMALTESQEGVRAPLDCGTHAGVPGIRPPIYNRRLALHLVCSRARQRFWTPDKSQPIIDTEDGAVHEVPPASPLGRLCKKRGCDPTGRLPTRRDQTSWCYALRLGNATLPQQSAPIVELVFRGLGD